MDTFWILVELAASLLLFLEFKRLTKVIRVCRLNDLKCTTSYVQATAMFAVSALLILAFYSDLEMASRRWAAADMGVECPEATAVNSTAQRAPSAKSSISGGGVVARVIDGDTVLLESGDRVTYIGVDAPEIVHPRKPVEPFGREAYRRNRELVEGKQITLHFDNRRRDRYNRIPAYVFSAGVFVNAELVRRGLARVVNERPGGQYAMLLAEAEREARQANRGVWETH